MACPSCFGLVFIGSKFCAHCGAIAAPLQVSLDENQRQCPRCQLALQTMAVGEISIDGCSKCDGIWLETGVFETVCADRERQSAVLGFLDHRTSTALQKTKVNYVPCPDCGQLMNRNNFARASGVIVDMCKRHGVWFDSDELPAIIDFVYKGGMEISRQRERNEIEQERERLRSEQRRQSIGDHQFGLRNAYDTDDLDVRAFVRGLFD